MLLSALKKLFAMGLAAVLMTSSLSCYAEKIGISLPNPDKPRFNLDGEVMKSELEANGLDVIVKSGDRTTETQIMEIEDLIAQGCEYLVIIPVDGTALGDVLNKAKEKNITVISYDRLIMNSDAVKYYATFDNYKVGEIMAEYLVKKLNLTQSGGEPKYIEFFSGDKNDSNVESLWEGSMKILKPYLEQGRLICRSSESTLDTTHTLNWEKDEASRRMTQLIDSMNYGPGEGKNQLDAVLCHNDGLALGVIEALYKNGEYRKENFPFVTGQDCQVINLKYIKRGMQAMSVFKDARVLAYAVANMIMQKIKGEEVLVNNTDTYTNGNSNIPTLLCSPKFVDRENMQEIIIESGFYDASELK